jgi:uncharacterized protein (DUF488 family)
VERLEADLHTIGHSNHPIERFLELLRRSKIEMVADVRSRPYFRFVPHFSREKLERLLDGAGIGYLFLGRELGGKPPRDDPARWPSDYQARIRDPGFEKGIERLLETAGARRVALLCRERDPLDCHRLHLICRYVKPMVGPIRHILPDGAIEDQAATERRLIERAGSSQELPLFETPGAEKDALERAYDACGSPTAPELCHRSLMSS